MMPGFFRSVRVIAHPAGNSSQISEKGRLKGVLKQDGQIESSPADEPDDPDDLGKVLQGPLPFLKGEDVIYGGVVFKEGPDPGPCQDRNGAMGKIFPDRVQGGKGHDHIPHPVRGPNKDATDL